MREEHRSMKKSRAPNGRSKTLASKKENKIVKKRKSGPRLPSSFRRELELRNPNLKSSDSDEEEEMEEGGDVYEYKEEMAEEESKKNRRYDPVENYEYELPEDFKVENVPSDDEEDIPSGGSDEDDEGGNKHLRMLGNITGMPSEAFDGKEKDEVLLTDLQGYLDHGKLNIIDFLKPLEGKAGSSKLRKRFYLLEKGSMAVQPPLPEGARKKGITKWELLIKRNREACTLYFQEDVNVGVSTVGTVASEFEPRT